jgi:hypothetical protein
MFGKPDASVPAGRPDRLRHEHSARQESAAERTGPVAIERLRKDDGRSLILYSYIQDPAEGHSV